MPAGFSEPTTQLSLTLAHCLSAKCDECLCRLACSLQVSSELEVFSALVTWVEHSPMDRMCGFARRLAAAVRLYLLSVPDLVFIDGHPLVSQGVNGVAHACGCSWTLKGKD